MLSAADESGIRALLVRMGFDASEVDVYLAVLTLSVARVTDIAKAARTSRTNVYAILKRLEDRGLVSRIRKEGVLHFVAEPPQKLVAFVQKQEEELHAIKSDAMNVLPLLQSLTRAGVKAPRVRVYQGIDRMKELLREVLTQEFLAVFNAEPLEIFFPEGILNALFQSDTFAMRGRQLLVSNAAAERFAQKCKQRSPMFQYRVLPPSMQFSVGVAVCGESVTVFCGDDDCTAIRLDGKPLADTLRVWFEAQWATMAQR